MRQKDADGMENIRLLKSSLIWVYSVCPDMSVRKLVKPLHSQDETSLLEQSILVDIKTEHGAIKGIINTGNIDEILKEEIKNTVKCLILLEFKLSSYYQWKTEQESMKMR